MKIESTGFTASELGAFLDELLEAERDSLVARLEMASRRVAELAGGIGSPGPAGDQGWQAHEVLAHIAVLSKFYGLLTYRVGTGAMTELDLLGNVNQRDILGQQLSQLPVADLAAQIARDHERTLAYLREAPAADLRREVRLSHGGTMSAGEIARLPLVAHLELHALQLEQTQGRSRA